MSLHEQCNNCSRKGDLVMQEIMPSNKHVGIESPWVFRFYLCQWHRAVQNRYRAKNRKKLKVVSFVSDDEMIGKKGI